MDFISLFRQITCYTSAKILLKYVKYTATVMPRNCKSVNTERVTHIVLHVIAICIERSVRISSAGITGVNNKCYWISGNIPAHADFQVASCHGCCTISLVL